MKKIYFALITILVFLGYGCSDDFLEREPSYKVTDDNYFENENDVLLALNAVYAQNDYYWYGLRNDAISDDAIIQHSNQRLYFASRGILSPSDWHMYDYYKFYFRGISRANTLIVNLKDLDGVSQEKKDRYEAEARFLRDYAYWVLVNWYGALPLMDKPVTPQEVKDLTRTPVEEIWKYLAKDLEWVADKLPLQYDQENVGRVTKGAALSLKARVLLWDKKYEEAAKMAKQVMDLKVYDLFHDYGKLFEVEGENCVEVIFDKQARPGVEGMDHYEFRSFSSNTMGGWSTLVPLQALVDAYECKDGYTIEESSSFDPEHPWTNRDPRLSYTIFYPGADYLDGMVYNTIPGATYPGQIVYPGDAPGEEGGGSEANKTRSGYNLRKYVIGAYYDNRGPNFWYNGINNILIRYAEVLLIYAEAKVEANDIDDSVYDALDKIRERVHMPKVDRGRYGSQETLRELVRRERRVELAFEGSRPFDIRRWRIAEDVFPGEATGLSYKDPETGETKTFSAGDRTFDPIRDYLWPIPQRERDVCPNLGQNPGY